MRKLALAVALVLLAACRETTAPATTCDPINNAKDSVSVAFNPVTGQTDSVAYITIKWCGPITVE